MHVLDRFHIMAKMNKAIDEVRAAEVKRLKRDGYEQVLKHSRWCLLKRPENLTDQADGQAGRVAEVQSAKRCGATCCGRTSSSSGSTVSPDWAGRFLDEWCTRVMRSRIEPMKKVARSFDGHRELILNWFRAKGTISAGVVEGLNNKRN